MHFSVDIPWRHKGDDRLIISDEWRIMIHQAIQSSLSVGKKLDYNMKFSEEPQIGDVVSFKVENINKSFVNGKISFFGKFYEASIHISNMYDKYIPNLHDFVSVGEELETVILSYDNKYFKWSLKNRNFSE